MFDRDTVALVTGAATGIGLATARAFAVAGCRVVLGDRDEARGEAAAAAIRENGGDALFVACDVAVEKDVARLHREAVAHYGRLDVACNNAGIEGHPAPTADCTLDNFDRTLGINLRGVFLCMQEQLRVMVPQRRGAIVNVSSVAGLVGYAGLPAYCASKGGVVQLTRAAALEYAEMGIRVNAVCPGAIRTEMIERIMGDDAEAEQAMTGLHPMGRIGTGDEVAQAILWLASSLASFVTGHALPVDGGLTAR